MTVTMRNVDASLFEVLKSLINIKSDVTIEKVNDSSDKTLSTSEQRINKINEVYSKIPVEEQTFTCNASKAAIWEMIKDDTW
ncbi:MAG: hypothetical protein IJ688_07790 [Treponema sp.]|nr:hypothetical protein [Treponema sp.]